jgi:hypothetical protein
MLKSSNKLIRGLVTLSLLSGGFFYGAACAMQPNESIAEDPDATLSNQVRLGDIMMRSLRVWPRNETDERDTLATAQSFKVDRIVWIYENESEFNDRVREKGMGIGTTMQQNAREFWINDLPRSEILDLVARFTIRSVTGEQVIRHHRTRFGPDHMVTHFEPDQTNPEWLDYYADYIYSLYQQGIDTLHRDDPAASFTAPRSGGNFTDSAIRYFQQYLESNFSASELREMGIANVREFDVAKHFRDLGAPSDGSLWQWRGSPLMAVYFNAMQEADRRFFLDLKERVETRIGKQIPWSLNATGPIDAYEEAFEFRIGEYQSHHNQPQTLLLMGEYARQRGKMQAWISMVDRNYMDLPSFTSDLRKHIATAYAIGTIPLVPWCMYMHDAPRYYGTVENYGDLFHFVSAHRDLFDEHEMLATSGVDTFARLYSWRPNKELIMTAEDAVPESRVWINSDNVFGITRKHPHKPFGVVHLVDWNEEFKPFEITLDPRSLIGGNSARLTLLRPGEQPVEWTNYRGETIEIPALGPWGIIKVEPHTGTASSLASPVVSLPQRSVVPAGSPIQFAAPSRDELIMWRFVAVGGAADVDYKSVANSEALRIEQDGILEAYTQNRVSGEKSAPVRIRFETFNDLSTAAFAKDLARASHVDLTDQFRVRRGEFKVRGSFVSDTMHLMGERVENGFSSQGDAMLDVSVQLGWDIFAVEVGIDDAEDRRPCGRFQVLFDGELAYETPIINPSKLALVDSEREVFNIKVKIPEGTRTIRLRAIPGGFFPNQNNFIWANPRAYELK